MKTELRVLFYSPIAWLILIVFAIQAGIVFTDSVRECYVGQISGNKYENLTQLIYGNLFRMMLDNLFLYIPLLTMGLMSREFGSGSIKLLYSSPVSNTQIILGKYFSMLLLGLGFTIIMIPSIIAGYGCIEHFDIGVTLVSLISFYLTFCAYAAIGLFMSTITHYQVVAALGTLTVLAILSFIDNIGQSIDWVREITYWLSITGRTRDILEGIIGTSDILYFILVILLFLTLSLLKLRGERLHLAPTAIGLQYGGLVVIVLLLGYLVSRPTAMKFWDATQMKENTLAEKSKDIMNKLPGKLTLTTYVNYLDYRNYIGMPKNRITDEKRFDKFRHQKPDLELKYVYYYHDAENPYQSEWEKGLSAQEKMEKKAEIDDLDTDMFLPAEQLGVDLEKEHYRFVRQFEYENGRKAFLRIYNDMKIHPFEMQVVTALKTLIDPAPTIGFVAGHGERNPYNQGDGGIGFELTDTGNRSSLINQGFIVDTLNLNIPVADSVDVLVLADVRKPLNNQEIEHFQKFIDRGGNLLIMAEPDQKVILNPIAELLGLQFASLPDNTEITTSVYTEDIVKQIPEFNTFKEKDLKYTTTSSAALKQIADKGFEVTDVLQTESSNEQYNVVKYLCRHVGEKEQRIFVFGDADAFTYENIRQNPMNYALISSLYGQLTYNRFPVFVMEAKGIDNQMIVTKERVYLLKALCVGGIPCLFILALGIVWFWRREK